MKLIKQNLSLKKSLYFYSSPKYPVINLDAAIFGFSGDYIIADKTLFPLPLKEICVGDKISLGLDNRVNDINKYYLVLLLAVKTGGLFIYVRHSTSFDPEENNIYHLTNGNFFWKHENTDIKYTLDPSWPSPSAFNIATHTDVQDFLKTINDTSQSLLTNTCVKCGYYNEYMDPVPNYICRQCKIREGIWS